MAQKRKREVKGFTILELIMALLIIGSLSTLAALNFSSLAEKTVTTEARNNSTILGLRFQRLREQALAQHPSAPWPTLSELGVQGFPLASDGSGICLGSHFKQPTFQDMSQAVPTSQGSDPVESMARFSVQDLDHCPGGSP